MFQKVVKILVDNDTLHALETDDFGKINSEILNVFYEPCVPPERRPRRMHILNYLFADLPEIPDDINDINY